MDDAPPPYTPPRPGRSTPGTLLYLLLGPVVWALRFGLAYGAQGALCELAAPGWAVKTMLLALTLPSLGLLTFALVAPGATARVLRAHGWEGETFAFLASAMRVLAAVSLFGIVAEGLLAPLILPACPALR